jgi:hypothetical protein
MSFSRATIRRSRPGTASTTIMWIEFDPMSIAARRTAGSYRRPRPAPKACGAAAVAERRPAWSDGAMRTVASPPARPPRARLAAVALLACVAVGAPPARGGDPGSATGCVVPVFVDDDATLIKAYDGLRLGLEEANLPRACRKAPATDDAAGWALAAREARDAGAPFVVALGRGASASVAATAFEAQRAACRASTWTSPSRSVRGVPDPPRRPAPLRSVRAERPRAARARRPSTCCRAGRPDSPAPVVEGAARRHGAARARGGGDESAGPRTRRSRRT